ncbi:MAG: hypothetical protein AAGB29_11565 [Planctomycetota bacterium]
MKYVAILLLLMFVVVVGCPITYALFKPDFSASVQRPPSGDYHITIQPNSIVRELYDVEITGPSGSIVQWKFQNGQPSQRVFTVPNNVPAGTTLTVVCGLQYDTLAPSYTSKSKSITLPP